MKTIHSYLTFIHAIWSLIFWRMASCISLQYPAINSIACSRLTNTLPIAASARTILANLTIDHTTWPITPSLSLAITVCNWEPSPATILAVLSAAENVVGKKPATALLDRKFVQRSDNKYNTLYFEISPAFIDPKKLTWGDVGEVLGVDGLVKFFETTRYWHTIYFDVMHESRGQLGSGAVRRWWQVGPPRDGIL